MLGRLVLRGHKVTRLDMQTTANVASVGRL
jgi:hypothetical protein